MAAAEERLYFPATQKNRDAIWQVLGPKLEADASVLEVASGSGEHAAYFASLRPDLQWQPSDPDTANRASIQAWCADLPNVAAPLDLDTSRWPAGLASYDNVVAINLIHISPWEAGLGLLQGASAALRPGGFLYLYGAFRRGGQHTSASNQAFDDSLRAQNPDWGVRDLEVVASVAAAFGMPRVEVKEMPSNNLSVFLYK